jgi:hypothetical protein
MGSNEKVGLRPLVCFAKCRSVHNSSQLLNIRPCVLKDKRTTDRVGRTLLSACL